MRNTRLNRNLEQAIKTWVSDNGVTPDYAVTLTSPVEFRNRDEASEYVRRFRKRLNTRLLRKKHTLHGRSIPMLTTIECRKRKMHIHIAMQCPQHVAPADLARAVHECWKASHKGARFAIADVRPIYDGGWLGYISKETSIRDTDALDVPNISWGT